MHQPDLSNLILKLLTDSADIILFGKLPLFHIATILFEIFFVIYAYI